MLNCMEPDVARRLVHGKPWHHAFEVIPGVRLDGAYDPMELWNELLLPEDLRGVSIADVGASNGFFSFEARRRGASVVAFDFRHRDNSGFGLLQHINGMDEIEHHHVNVLDLDPREHGSFDVVLALGLFYHVSDPYMAIARCTGICRDRLLIESYCIDGALHRRVRGEPVMRFLSDPVRFPEEALNEEQSNYWGFTSECLRRMVSDVGFQVDRAKLRGDRVLLDCRRVTTNVSDTRLWLAYGIQSRKAMSGDPNDPDAWTIF
jgi:tRNA (mo5U34)-methyltransferase